MNSEILSQANALSSKIKSLEKLLEKGKFIFYIGGAECSINDLVSIDSHEDLLLHDLITQSLKSQLAELRHDFERL